MQGMLVQPNAAQLAQIAQLIDAGKVHITVDTVLPLVNARKAHELSETHRTRGKSASCSGRAEDRQHRTSEELKRGHIRQIWEQ